MMQTRTTYKMVENELGQFCVKTRWEGHKAASATPDHGDETWTEWIPTSVEITDEDGGEVSFFCPDGEEVTSELDKLVMDMIESEDISPND